MKKNRYLVSSLAAIVLCSNSSFCHAGNPNKTTTNEQPNQVIILDIEKSIDINLEKLKSDPFYKQIFDKTISQFGSYEKFKESMMKSIVENQDLIIKMYGSLENYNRSLQNLPEKLKNSQESDTKLHALKIKLSEMIGQNLASDEVQEIIFEIDQLMKELSWPGFKGSEELKKWTLEKFVDNPEELKKYNEVIFKFEEDQDKKYGEGFSKFFNDAVEYYVKNNTDNPNDNSITKESTIIDIIKPVTTDRLKIELTTEEDCLHLAKYFKDKGVQDTFGMERELSESEALENLRTMLLNSSSAGLKVFTIKTLDNEPIGQVWISLKEINTPNCISISSWIGKPFWGKSIAPESVCALVSQIDNPDLDISFTVSSTNEKSKRAILKTVEKLSSFIKDSNVKFYLKEQNTYRTICSPVEGDVLQMNLKFYKNDELLSEQNVSKNILPENSFKDSSSIEYIFSKTTL